MYATRWFVIPAAAMLFACSTDTTPSPDAGPGAGGSAGQAQNDGSAGSDAGDAAPDASDADAGDACSAYKDFVPHVQSDDSGVAPTPVTTVRFENQRTQTIYVDLNGHCGPYPPFALADSAQHDLPLAFSCGGTCEELQTSDIYGCDASCPQYLYAVRIEPGGHYDYTWNNTVFALDHMPGSCFHSPIPGEDTCWQRVLVPDGTYTVSARGSATCANCSCTPDASGSCLDTLNAQIVQDELSASVQADLPASTLTLVFQ